MSCSDEGEVAFGLFGQASPELQFQRVFVYDRDLNTYRGIYGHTFSIQDVEFLGDGSTLVSLRGDRTIRLTDIHSRQLNERLTIQGPAVFNCLAVSPDDRIIAAGTREGTVILYRVPSLPPD